MHAVADLKSSEEVVLTSKAMDLMSCFQGDLEELAIQIAEDVARERHRATGLSMKIIEITDLDVRDAANKLVQFVQEYARSGQLSQAAAKSIHGMRECVHSK